MFREDISERIIDSISNLLMPLCSVWIVNKFVNNSFEKERVKKDFYENNLGTLYFNTNSYGDRKGKCFYSKGIISFLLFWGELL